MVQAIKLFSNIMSKKHEAEEKDGQMVYPTFENPLLPGKVPDEYELAQAIDSRETIFAVFYKMVDDALVPYLKFVRENLMDKAAQFAEQKGEEFVEKKNELIEKYTNQCDEFTNGFNNPELQS